MCSPANALVDRDWVHAGAGTVCKAICGKLCGLCVRWLDSHSQADTNGLRWESSHPVIGPKCRERSLNMFKFLVWPVSFLFNLVGSPSCLWSLLGINLSSLVCLGPCLLNCWLFIALCMLVVVQLPFSYHVFVFWTHFGYLDFGTSRRFHTFYALNQLISCRQLLGPHTFPHSSLGNSNQSGVISLKLAHYDNITW